MGLKVYYVYNSSGVTEIINYPTSTLGLTGKEEWEEVEVKSDVISKYEVFDGIGRISVEESVTSEEMLEEVEVLDEELWY